jgi:hypothetical protein
LAEDIGDKIVERLRQEGQLTRNSGTNSIKAVRSELAKFNDVFQSINSNVVEQTQILRETLQLQMEEAGKAERARQLEEARRSGPSTTETTPSTERAERRTQRNESSHLSGLAALFGGGLGGFGGAVTGSALAALRAPLRTAILAAVAPAIGKMVGEFAESALIEIGTNAEVATRFGQAANFAGLAGMIGLAFRKRMGLVAAAGGAAAAFSDELLDVIGIEDENVTIFGQEFKSNFLAFGGLAAIGATAALIAPSLLGLAGKLIVGALIGPVGLAALTGAAVAGTVLLIEDWIEQRKNVFLKELENETAKGLGNVGRIKKGDSPNIFRRLQLYFGSEARTPGEELTAAIQQIERTGRLSESDVIGGIGETVARTLTPEQIKNTETILRNILNIPESADLSSFDFSQINLSKLSDDLLNDMRRVSEMIGLDGLIARLDDATAIVERTTEIQDRISNLIVERQSIEESSSISSIPLSQSQIGRITQIQDEISELNQHLKEINGYSAGTRGFQDFGRGSFAVLHGREAVVPEATPAGQFLKNYFDENWQPLISRVNEVANAATSQFAGSITYAPVTMTPITNNNNVRGGSSSTILNSVSNNMSDLDYLSIPGGAK